MRLIKQYCELIDSSDYKKTIELAARVCYKSEDKICEGSADKMVDMLIKNNHGAMLEHGTIYLRFPGEALYYDLHFSNYGKYNSNKYSTAKRGNYGDLLVTTNYRVIVENGWEDDLKFMCKPTDLHDKRITVKFITSIGIVRELLRHRVFSFANESSRFCNYSKDKFGNEITFINSEANGDSAFIDCLKQSEKAYFTLLKDGYKPEIARDVLPLATKSELIMTGFESDWKQLIALRIAPTAHPDMIDLISQLKEKLC